MEKKIQDIVLNSFDSDDVQIAICAAVKMAQLFREDFVIMPDLSVVRLRECSDIPLEIIRYDETDKWRYEQ